jgi:hypothetical protein
MMAQPPGYAPSRYLNALPPILIRNQITSTNNPLLITLLPSSSIVTIGHMLFGSYALAE